MAYWNMVGFLDTMTRVANRRSLQKLLAAKAQHAFEETYRLSKHYSNSIAALFALDKLAKVESYQGNKDAAYQHMRLYNTLHDSVFSQQNINRIAQLENQRAIDLRDKQLQINRLQIGNQRKQAILLICCLVLLIAVALLIYFRSRNRKRVNAQLTQLNQELDAANTIKNKFIGILNHDLKRPVADFVTLRRLQQTEPGLMSEKDQQKYDEQLTHSAEDLLNTMDDLLLWSKGQMKNFAPEFRSVSVKALFNYIAHTFRLSKVKFTFPELADDLVICSDEHYLKTIMLNLTNNATSALSFTDQPAILWECLESDEHLYLSITDNGPGANEQKFRPLYDDSVTIGIKNGLGLHIIRDLAKAIDCQILLDTHRPSGVKISIKFKKSTLNPD